MSVKTASVTLDGSNLRFVARTGSGHSIVLDDGRGDTGPRPAELIPVALAACTGMDVISILRKKRQQVTRYEVRADGVQEDGHPNAFTRIPGGPSSRAAPAPGGWRRRADPTGP
jgi:putative redox protein